MARTWLKNGGHPGFALVANHSGGAALLVHSVIQGSIKLVDVGEKRLPRYGNRLDGGERGFTMGVFPHAANDPSQGESLV